MLFTTKSLHTHWQTRRGMREHAYERWSSRKALANISVSLSHSSELSQHFIHSKWALKISKTALWEVEEASNGMETLGKYTETCLLLRWQSLIYYYTSLPLSLSLSLSYSPSSFDLTSFTISRKRHLSYEVLSDKRPKRHLNTPGGGGERKKGREADPDCVLGVFLSLIWNRSPSRLHSRRLDSTFCSGLEWSRSRLKQPESSPWKALKDFLWRHNADCVYLNIRKQQNTVRWAGGWIMMTNWSR